MATTIFNLPPELRLIIYHEVLTSFDLNLTEERYFNASSKAGASIEPTLLRTCQQIRNEAMKTYYRRLLAISEEVSQRHSAAHDKFIQLLVKQPVNAMEACAVARELDEVHETFQRTKEVVLAELRKIEREGFPVQKWCERDGEAAGKVFWAVEVEMEGWMPLGKEDGC